MGPRPKKILSALILIKVGRKKILSMANAHLPHKNIPILCPIVAFSYHYEMKIVSVILFQNETHDLSVNFR